ncbi:hypothetical protein [Streptosporangium sp. NPDC051022]
MRSLHRLQPPSAAPGPGAAGAFLAQVANAGTARAYGVIELVSRSTIYR